MFVMDSKNRLRCNSVHNGINIGNRITDGDVSINGVKNKTDQAKITTDVELMNFRFNLIKSVYSFRKSRSVSVTN